MFFDAREFTKLEKTTPSQIRCRDTVKVALPTKNVHVSGLHTCVQAVETLRSGSPNLPTPTCWQLERTNTKILSVTPHEYPFGQHLKAILLTGPFVAPRKLTSVYSPNKLLSRPFLKIYKVQFKNAYTMPHTTVNIRNTYLSLIYIRKYNFIHLTCTKSQTTKNNNMSIIKHNCVHFEPLLTNTTVYKSVSLIYESYCVNSLYIYLSNSRISSNSYTTRKHHTWANPSMVLP